MTTLAEGSKVSIIVPVFNSASTIIRCLQSIDDQSYANLDIIVVDDCSSDESAELIDGFIADKPKFRVIKFSQNRGVSHARNIGIQSCIGHFVAFVDSDDYLKQQYVESLVKVSDGVDLVCSSFGLQYLSDKPLERHHGLDCSTILTKRDLGVYLSNFFYKPYKYTLFLHVWNKLFIKSIIENNDIFFDVQLSQLEDVNFVCNYLNHVNRVKFIDTSGYIQWKDDRGKNLSSLSGLGGREAINHFFQALAPLTVLERKVADNDVQKRPLGFEHFLASMSILFCLRIARRFWKSYDLSSVVHIQQWLSDKRLKNCFRQYGVVSGESRALRFFVRCLPSKVSSLALLFFGLHR